MVYAAFALLVPCLLLYMLCRVFTLSRAPCSGIPINHVDTNPAKGAKFPAGGAIVFDEWPEESDPGAPPAALLPRWAAGRYWGGGVILWDNRHGWSQGWRGLPPPVGWVSCCTTEANV